jgi:acyl dehydratase
MPRTFDNLDAFSDAVGEDLGTGEWFTITQKQINTFAEATGDHQWIHVDPERAADGPFGGTIAHGYLTLALVPVLLESAFEVKNLTMGVNYGTNKVRFPAPVPVDSRIRASATLREVTKTPVGSQIVVSTVVEREGGDKPVCVADIVYVWSGAPEPGQSDGEAG